MKKETYFLPLENHSTWEWTVDFSLVTQFVDGPTIAYQNELIPILREVQGVGLPKSIDIIFLLIHALKSKTGEYVPDYLKNVYQLPDEIKKIENHPYIIKVLIKKVIQKDYRLGFVESREMVDFFLASPLKNFISTKKPIETNRIEKENCFYHFENEFEEWFDFPDVLLNFLETGLSKVPTLIEEVELPTIHSEELFHELKDDKDTKGIFELVQEVTAALKIPMHLKNGGDQPLGGFSDITNKGTVDKLLLTELAYDDVFFMARLVNNESLYFRRETPPPDEHESKNILIDTTIRMWGIPHVFANAIALACFQKYHKKWMPTVYSLGEEVIKEKLETQEGIINSLKKLSGKIDCTESLLSFLENEKEDSIFITNQLFLNSKSYQQKAHFIQEQLKFIITVERTGEMIIYECIRGARKEISQSQFDLTKSLFTVQIKDYKKKKSTNNTELPPLWQKEIFPLLYPAMRIQVSAKKTFFIAKENEESLAKTFAVLAISDNQRVLYWEGREKGAREILPFIEDGNYYFGYLNERIYVLILDEFEGLSIINLYRINLNDYSYQTISINKMTSNNDYGGGTISLDTFKFDAKIVNVKFLVKDENAIFHLHTSQKMEENITYAINCEMGEMMRLARQDYSMEMFQKKQVSRMINNGYNVFQNPFSAYVVDGILVIGNYYLDLNNLQFKPIKGISLQIKGKPKQEEALFIEEKGMVHSEKKALTFQSATFEDGSQIILDNYGFGHFISSDAKIPPFVLALFLNKQTMAYVDSKLLYCGNEYFKDLEKCAYNNNLTTIDFSNNYWIPFINNIIL